MLGLAERGVARRIEHFGSVRERGVFVHGLRQVTSAAASGDRHPDAARFERRGSRRRNRRHPGSRRHLDARRRGATGDEEQRRAVGADAAQLGPVVPLMFDARQRERTESLPAQLDRDAIGVRLRFRDDPGVWQFGTSAGC
jgi:hypothetical protein